MSEVRLIDGNSVALFLVEKGQHDTKKFKLGEIIRYSPSEVGELIKEMPTIDPVRVHNEKVEVPYCWYCGARMDGEEDE